MVTRIQTDVAARLNQYANVRRKGEKSFAEAVQTAKGEAARVASTARRGAGRQGAVAPYGGRRGARLQGSAGRPLPKLITTVQAARLARYATVIQQASRRFGVPIELICGVMIQESGGRAAAVSHCGATGLMQLMPATARRMGVSNSYDPVQNIMGGTKYLRMLLDRFGGNIALAVAGYNAGEGNVEKYGRRIPPFAETRAYVPNVLKYADTIWHLLRSGAPVKRVAANPAVHHRTIF
jgi:soluble lytic murein transglycosylase-like protein